MTAPVPAPTPQEKALKRVLAIAAFDGWSLVVIAGLSLLLTLAMVEPIGIAISLVILAGGVIELRGRRALKRADAATGMKLLVRSQLLVLTVILLYCARSLGSFDAGYVQEQLIPLLDHTYQSALGISLADLLAQNGLTTADLLPLVHTAFLALYGSVALVTLIYQGGMTLYYRRKTPLVTEALAAPPQLPQKL